QAAIRSGLGTANPTQITQLQGTNGVVYTVQYDVNGRPMLMTLTGDGQVVNNVPITTQRTAGANRASNSASDRGNAGATQTGRSRETALKAEDLPAEVQNALKREARHAEVRSITREDRVGGEIYVIGLRGENSAGQLTIDSEGTI